MCGSNRDGQERRLSYVDSRQFYCNFYERLASQKSDFKRLVELMDEVGSMHYYNIKTTGTL